MTGKCFECDTYFCHIRNIHYLSLSSLSHPNLVWVFKYLYLS